MIIFSVAYGKSNLVELFVATDGNDGNKGTRDQPMASLEGAKNRVREIKSSHTGNITVWFEAGEYILKKRWLLKSLLKQFLKLQKQMDDPIDVTEAFNNFMNDVPTPPLN